MTDRQYYLLKGYLAEYIDNPTYKQVETFAKIRRLARKHHRLAEYDCNGEGIIRGKYYSLADKEGYLADGETSVFTAESDKIEQKITKLAETMGLTTEFQGDPRGATVKLHTNTSEIYPLYV